MVTLVILLFYTLAGIIKIIALKTGNEDLEWWSPMIGFYTTIPAVVVLMATMILYFDLNTIDDKIDYLYEYNETIDKEIHEIVSSYMSHEERVFSRDSNAIVLVERYPELKSNELVKSQMDIYLNNRSEIKELELDRIKLEGRKKLYYLWGRD